MNALYLMEYGAGAGHTVGVLYIGRGLILGLDVRMVRYEGTYDEDRPTIAARITLTGGIPGTTLVTGYPLEPGRSLQVDIEWPHDLEDGPQEVFVHRASATVQLEKIGDLP